MNSAQHENPKNQLHITMCLHPLIYINSEVLGSAETDVTDVTPDNMYINPPLPGDGEELETPIKDEWKSFIRDCKFVIKEAGYSIIKSEQNNATKKSEYVITYGLGNITCGTVVCNLQVSENPFDAAFPEEYKEKVQEYLKENNILDGIAREAGIDFQVEQVTIDDIKISSWCDTITELYELMRNQVKKRGD